MLNQLAIFPVSMWMVIFLIIAGAIYSLVFIHDGCGMPMIGVLLTVATWYVGDAFYNDYANHHAQMFDAAILADAWWQVAWFLLVFLMVTPWMNSLLNSKFIESSSGVIEMLRNGLVNEYFQSGLNQLFSACFIVWLALVFIAAFRLRGEVIYYLFPFIAYKAEPWGRDRIGGGFDALLSLAGYVQLLVASEFGVVWALSTDRRTRFLALLLCLMTWPYYVFDRTRNTMLATVMPGVLSWAILRIRSGFIAKSLVLLACFLVVNGWMKFVIANRSHMSIVQAFKERGDNDDVLKESRHEGLNMYEELCYINKFLEDGSYKPNWGSRYFAELVNPIPRSLWQDKPMIGIDYAVARGVGEGDASSGGVSTSISTGLIGQGVVNFGHILGPAAAAVLTCLWVCSLARLDLNINELGRLPLYAIGLILTFNLGRDFTLITLYPFVFGALGVWLYSKMVKANNIEIETILEG